MPNIDRKKRRKLLCSLRDLNPGPFAQQVDAIPMVTNYGEGATKREGGK